MESAGPRQASHRNGQALPFESELSVLKYFVLRETAHSLALTAQAAIWA